MFPSELIPLVIILATLYLVVVVVSYVWMRHTRRAVKDKEQEVQHRLYEVAILKEIADRTGYSLNMRNILDVISGSLDQFLEYSAVAYMLLDPAKVTFKVVLDHSVSADFIKDMRARMLSSLMALSGRDLADVQIEEILTGALQLESASDPIRSYFNIPLVIGGELVGVLTIASTKAGLYKEEEMEILYKIISQASQAVTRLEEVVRTEQGKIAAMLQSMVEGVVMTDRDYRVLAANPAAKKIIGYTQEGLPTIFDFMGVFKDSLDIKGKLEEAIKLDKMVSVAEVVLGDKYYQILITPVRLNTGAVKGEILGGAIIFHDVTHEKEAEKMRNSFTSMMVHELRAPLGNIKKIGELMRSSKVLEDKKETGEYVTMLYESSSSMLDLVNDLLDVARLEAGKFEIFKQPASIQEIIRDRVNFFSVTAQDAGVRLVPLVGADVPRSFLLDQKRIAQALDNFLSNALKYTARSGVITIACFLHRKGATFAGESRALGAPWIESHGGAGQDHGGHGGAGQGAGQDAGQDGDLPAGAEFPDSVVVAVTDTGTGISRENLGKLWNKFTQFETSVRERDHKGTGLGLVIIKGIIEAHGGSVGVGSQVGKGSTFYFTLPL